jgi:hypothetical protein
MAGEPERPAGGATREPERPAGAGEPDGAAGQPDRDAGGVPVQPGRPWWIGALAGLAATALALAVAELVAILSGPVSAPLVSVGGVVIDHTPLWLKQFAVDTFGTGDKAALLIGTAVLLAAFGAGIGVLALRWPWVGYPGVCVFGVIGALAAYTR